jgi:hypothetical protein
MSAFNVKAHWDTEARVWWAESDDVPGLVAEAESHDQLVADLHQIASSRSKSRKFYTYKCPRDSTARFWTYSSKTAVM